MNDAVYLYFFLVLIQILSFYAAEWVTWRGTQMYFLRKKYGFLNKKPFTCTPCLTFWITLLTNVVILLLLFPNEVLGSLVLSMFFALYIFIVLDLQEQEPQLWKLTKKILTILKNGNH